MLHDSNNSHALIEKNKRDGERILGPIEGNSAILDVALTTGGLFDDSTPVNNSQPGSYGTIILEFSSCSEGLISYDLLDSGLAGEIPIGRIASDNVALCEELGL